MRRGVLINLGSRPDRLNAASRELDRAGVDWRLEIAIDGRQVKDRRGYDSDGAYALGLRMRLVLRRALREEWEHVWFFEGGVVISDELREELRRIELPEDWGLFYLGANHVGEPEVVAWNLLKCRRAQTTHAFCIRRPYFRKLLKAWTGKRGDSACTIVAVDQVLARMQNTEIPAYACHPNLAWQREGVSDIDGEYRSHYDAEGAQWHWREHLTAARLHRLETEYETALAEAEEGTARLIPPPPEGPHLRWGGDSHGADEATASPKQALTIEDMALGQPLRHDDRTAASITIGEGLSRVPPESMFRLLMECHRVLNHGGSLKLRLRNLASWCKTVKTSDYWKEAEERKQPKNARFEEHMRVALSQLGHLWHSEDMQRLLTVAGFILREDTCPTCADGSFWLEAHKPRNKPGHIPRLFHAVWLGPKPLPAQYQAWMRTWQDIHPGWEFILWTDRDFPLLALPHKYNESANYAQMADIIRAEVVFRHGGVYLDTDMECFQSIEPIIAGLSGFIGCELPNRPALGIFGASPEHPLMLKWVEKLRNGPPFNGNQLWEAGPDFAGQLLRSWLKLNEPGLAMHDAAADRELGVLCRDRYGVFEPWVFYPYYMHAHWNKTDHPHCYAAHHWSLSWL